MGLRSHARCNPYPIPQPVKVGHTTEVYVPYSFQTVAWVLLCPTRTDQWKCFETGPTVFRPYPWRLESLTVCRCHYKGSTLFSDPDCWSGRGLNPWPPARQTGTLPTELTRRWLNKVGWPQASVQRFSNFVYRGTVFGYVYDVDSQDCYRWCTGAPVHRCTTVHRCTSALVH